MAANNVDPAIQKIFDEIEAYLALTYASCNLSVLQDGQGRTETFTLRDFRGNETSYTNRHVGNRVVLSPPSASATANQTLQFTASAVDPEGKPIANPAFTWSLSAGAQGSISQSGQYTAPAMISAMSADAVTATLNGALASASATVGLRPAEMAAAAGVPQNIVRG